MRLLVAIVSCSVLVFALGAGAADSARESKRGPETSRDHRSDQAKQAPKKQDPLADVTHCKRAAHGTDGPERSRFMTECIRRN